MTTKRLLYVDNLRILLITLVILVHLSVTYGGEGGWYYKEGRADTVTSVVLTFHNAVCQSFFMGFLFLISAYLTPGSFDRKGPHRFLRDRFLRLGIPLLIYEFVMNPLLIYLLYAAGELELEGAVPQMLRRYYTSFHIGSGPLWFVETLLIFALVYAGCRAMSRHADASGDTDAPPPNLATILALGALLGALTFVVRIGLPVGWAFGPLNLQFPFFIQYIAMLAVGVVAYRHNWFERLPRTLLAPALSLAGVLIMVAFPVMFALGGALSGNVTPFLGGLHWQAFAYAMWEQVLGVVLIAGLLILFRERFNRQNAPAREASAAGYTVYIIHGPVVVLFALAARDIRMYPLLKFALAALVAVPASFALGGAIRRLPLARRIL
jgi:surface polysaccharide O-acyltransferase-like enzyme